MTEIEKLCGIFTCKCLRSTNKIKIRHIQNLTLKNQEYVGDTLLHDFKIQKNVICGIYLCNITDTFIMTSKKLPVMYLNVAYEIPMQKYLLYRVYLCFTITDNVKSDKDLLNKELEGKYSIEISIDGQRKDIDDQISVYPGDERMYEKLEKFAKAELMVELTQSLVDEINQKREEEYKKKFISYKPPENIISLKNYKLD